MARDLMRIRIQTILEDFRPTDLELDAVQKAQRRIAAFEKWQVEKPPRNGIGYSGETADEVISAVADGQRRQVALLSLANCQYQLARDDDLDDQSEERGDSVPLRSGSLGGIWRRPERIHESVVDSYAGPNRPGMDDAINHTEQWDQEEADKWST